MYTVPKYSHKYLILAIASLFYGFTLAPTVIGGDSPILSLKAQNLALHFGRASDHPLHTVIGKLFSLLPFELAFSLNLMSAFFGVLTVLLIFLIVKHLTKSESAAWFGQERRSAARQPGSSRRRLPSLSRPRRHNPRSQCWSRAWLTSPLYWWKLPPRHKS